MEITPLGDSALIVRVAEKSQATSKRGWEEVSRILARIDSAEIPGGVELVPAYATIGVFFDPAKIIGSGVDSGAVLGWLSQRIREVIEHPRSKVRSKVEPRLVQIPTCFDEEFAIDLQRVAEHVQLSIDDAVDLYCANEYRVACVGFTPGFPYLAGLPEKLATPRHSTPRKDLSAGSVAIGGGQAGIYPQRSPGGWNVIGRTPLQLFDPATDPPALLRVGDRVRFRAIDRAEFARSTV